MYLTGEIRVNDVKQAKMEHGLYGCCHVAKRPRACKGSAIGSPTAARWSGGPGLGT